MKLPEPATHISLPDGFDVLADLAFDLRSSWNQQAEEIWREIDQELWRDTGNAWLVLQTASHDRIRELWGTPRFRALVEALREDRRSSLAEKTWFQSEHAAARLGAVAFFSLEFALSEALALYSGGLGNVAGDYLKAASDLGVPLVGVGLLYQQGYFRQVIDAEGRQREFYPFNRAGQMPVAPVRDATGRWVRVRVPRPGPPTWLRAWGARVGRVALYLLDSDDPSNTPADRGITAQLYGGGDEVRLLQEMALGIGGWRLLRALGLRPEVCHLNEGHAALVTLERARDFTQETGRSFATALAATRAGNVFTTHTPVESGFDRFPSELFAAYLGAYARDELHITTGELLDLGRARPGDDREPVSMAWLATRGSGAVNAVSRRHGEVSRRIFQPLFPRWPEVQVPVAHVTNGVHVPSWSSAVADGLWSKACGPAPWARPTDEAGRPIARSSDAELWAFRAQSRSVLVDLVRRRLELQLAAAGMGEEALEAARRVLDPDTLTIGMARRFTAYKRPCLLLHDAERFARLLTDGRRPVQIVVAGKAHPRDEEGKGLVQRWIRFVRRGDVRHGAVFLADYDLRLAERLVQGVDLWLNTPRSPWEACGTSGMKVLVNGGVNLSSLDGWWAEAYRPEVGWALEGDGRDDARDAAELYGRLEREVVPAFYERDISGLPTGWLARVRASMASLTSAYSASRTLRDYTNGYYLPAAEAFARRSAEKGALAERIVAWERAVRAHWSALRFGDVRVTTDHGQHHFAVTVYLDDMSPDDIAVELHAEGERPTLMRRDTPLVGAHGHVYVADVPDARPAAHFAARIVPRHAEAGVPLELPLVAWSR